MLSQENMVLIIEYLLLLRDNKYQKIMFHNKIFFNNLEINKIAHNTNFIINRNNNKIVIMG